jgi:DNA-binding NarL/FixJ family response regulator
LPGQNGLELTKKIKAAHPKIIILILTNYDILEYREAAFQFGADHFFTKSSLNSTELKELVRTYAEA